MNHVELSGIATYVEERISSDAVSLEHYVTTDSLLQNKAGREQAQNLPPNKVTLTKYQPGDVLVANIRPYLRKIWQADCSGGCSADVLVFRARPNHSSDFLYAVLMQDAFFDHVMAGKKGAKMPRGDKKQIMRYLVPDVSTDKEQQMGQMIASISQKIALNQRLNDNLEAMAQALYDYWFVQFDFPDENGKPYKSSGGKMVWNEKLKREIPVDWLVAPLSDFGELRNGVNYSKGESGNFEYKIINVRNISSSRHLISIDDLDVVSLNEKKGSGYIVNKNDILIARSGVPGAVRLIETKGANIIFCGFIIAFGIRDIERRYSLYYQLKEYEGTTATTTGGTILQNVSQETLKRLQLLMPPPLVLQGFNARIARIYGRLESLQLETASLIKQRDFLLPLLMSGQVQVKPQGELNYHLSAD